MKIHENSNKTTKFRYTMPFWPRISDGQLLSYITYYQVFLPSTTVLEYK